MQPRSRVAPFEGVGVALVTLFERNGALDAPATAAHAARLVDAGIRGVVVAGSTGEAATLDPDERSALLAAVRESVAGRVSVLAGTGAPSAGQAVALSRRAADGGADALLALSPPGADDARRYYEALVAAVDVPVLGYHFPAVSAPGIPVDLLQARAMGCSGAILALANVDPAGCAQAWDGDGACQRELINGHRVGALAGIAGLKRTLAALHGTSPVTRVG